MVAAEGRCVADGAVEMRRISVLAPVGGVAAPVVFGCAPAAASFDVLEATNALDTAALEAESDDARESEDSDDARATEDADAAREAKCDARADLEAATFAAA